MANIEYVYQLFENASGITTDSRKIAKGNLFFALKGDNFDGNKFAEQALKDGASYAIVDDKNLASHAQLIVVDDVLKSLQDLANHHRRQFKIPVIGITGSNGKTTTKELLFSVLNSHYQTHWTKGNFNNHIGVPLTLLNMPVGTEIAVIEMGANHVGEIKFLCEIAEPTHGVITNIGKAHLEGFGGIEGVKKGKSELYRFLAKRDGVAFINLDEAHLKELGNDVARKIFYQESQELEPHDPAFQTKLLTSASMICVSFLSDNETEEEVVNSNLVGQYNFNNIQTAIAIGRYFKVPSSKIKAAIEQYEAKNNRSQIVKIGTNTIIMDAYNANPTSMAIALDNLSTMKADRKIAIIGDMLELGDYSKKEHQAILQQANAKPFDQVIVVGEEFKKAMQEDTSILYFDHVKALKVWFDQQNIHDTLILLKGSRGIRLEQLF